MRRPAERALPVGGVETSEHQDTALRHDPTPLYHRIYVVLRAQIMENVFSRDEPMPSEIALAEQFAVSRITIRKAFERLEEEGLIVRQRGRGTFAHPPQASRAFQADVTGLVDNLLALGMRTQATLLEFGYIPASVEIAVAMGLRKDEVVQRAVRTRSFEGKPFSYATTYVPETVGRHFTREDLARQPLLHLIIGAGFEIAGARQWVTARAADPIVAPQLEVEIGAPLLSVTRIVRDRSERVVELLKALYHPERYEFETTMSVGSGAEGGAFADGSLRPVRSDQPPKS